MVSAEEDSVGDAGFVDLVPHLPGEEGNPVRIEGGRLGVELFRGGGQHRVGHRIRRGPEADPDGVRGSNRQGAGSNSEPDAL